MSTITYGRMLLNEFSNMEKTYNYESYLNKLEDERLKSLRAASDEEIKKYNLYKKHYLVRFIDQTISEIENIEKQFCCDSVSLIDEPSVGNSPRFKNDLMSLRVFISKMKTEGCYKYSKIS